MALSLYFNQQKSWLNPPHTHKQTHTGSLWLSVQDKNEHFAWPDSDNKFIAFILRTTKYAWKENVNIDISTDKRTTNYPLLPRCMLFCLLNPFPHIDTFWRLCCRRLFENIVTKEKIAQNKQFLLLPQCFLLLVIGYPFN